MFGVVSHYDKVVFAGCDADEQVEILNGLANGLLAGLYRGITVDHIIRTKDEILPLAKQLMQSVEFHSHPICLLGLRVSNQKSATAQKQQPWVEQELKFEPWPEA